MEAKELARANNGNEKKKNGGVRGKCWMSMCSFVGNSGKIISCKNKHIAKRMATMKNDTLANINKKKLTHRHDQKKAKINIVSNI